MGRIGGFSKQKGLLRAEKSLIKDTALISQAHSARRIWHHISFAMPRSSWLPGFKGPIPPPLLMGAATYSIVTDTEILHCAAPPCQGDERRSVGARCVSCLAVNGQSAKTPVVGDDTVASVSGPSLMCVLLGHERPERQNAGRWRRCRGFGLWAEPVVCPAWP